MAPRLRLYARSDAGGAASAPRRVLVCAGLGFLLILTLAALLFRVPWLASNRAVSLPFGCLFAAGSLAAYLGGYRALQALPDDSASRMLIVTFAAAFGFLALCIPPFHSIDVFSYINVGWQQAHYGLNPYACTLEQTPGWREDPMFQPYWTDVYASYGVLFTRLSEALCRLGNGDPARTLVLFKVVSLAVYSVTGWVGWLGARRLGLAAPERALYLFLWNPLVLIHLVANGHNDLWMALCTLTAGYCALVDAWVGVLPALAAGCAIKYVSGALLPLAFLYLVRRFGWKKAAAGAALTLLLGGLMGLQSLWNGGKPFPLVAQVANLSSVHNSIPALIVDLYKLAARFIPCLAPHRETAAVVAKALFWGGFAVFYCRLAWLRLRGGAYDKATFLHDCVLVQFVLVFVVSTKMYAWYVGMFFPLALWLPRGGRLRRAVLAVSCAQLLSLTFVDTACFLNGLLMVVLPVAWALSPSFFARRRSAVDLGRPEHLGRAAAA